MSYGNPNRERTPYEEAGPSPEISVFSPETVTASEASWEHPDRNEDAALGDSARLDAESGRDSRIDVNTDPAFAESDRQLVRNLAMEESELAERLAGLNISGVLDGVSGTKKGEGLLASRLASAEMAGALSRLDRTAENDPVKTRDVLKAALLAANERIGAFKSGGRKEGAYDYRANKGRETELAQTACTAELMRLVEKDDGSMEVAFAHAGDGALLHFDSASGRLKTMTRPHDALSVAVEHGAMTEDERRAIMSKDDSRWPPRLTHLKKAGRMLRQGMISNINGKDLRMQMDETAGLLTLLAKGKVDAPPRFDITEEDIIQTGTFSVDSGDIVIPCTDGLIDNIPRDVIERIVKEHSSDLKAMRAALVEEATNRGGGGFDIDKGEPVDRDPDAKGADDISFEIVRIPEGQIEELSEADIEIIEGDVLEPEDIGLILEEEGRQTNGARKEIAEMEMPASELPEDVEESPAPKKKGGLFSRLFGGK